MDGMFVPVFTNFFLDYLKIISLQNVMFLSLYFISRNVDDTFV